MWIKKTIQKVQYQAQKFDQEIVKGKYYYMNYNDVPSQYRKQEVREGMQAGFLRIFLGIFLLILCIVAIIMIVNRF
jgi:hypothetical protein